MFGNAEHVFTKTSQSIWMDINMQDYPLIMGAAIITESHDKSCRSNIR